MRNYQAESFAAIAISLIIEKPNQSRQRRQAHKNLLLQFFQSRLTLVLLYFAYDASYFFQLKGGLICSAASCLALDCYSYSLRTGFEVAFLRGQRQHASALY